jgi:hypothetical protein
MPDHHEKEKVGINGFIADFFDRNNVLFLEGSNYAVARRQLTQFYREKGYSPYDYLDDSFSKYPKARTRIELYQKDLTASGRRLVWRNREGGAYNPNLGTIEIDPLITTTQGDRGLVEFMHVARHELKHGLNAFLDFLYREGMSQKEFRTINYPVILLDEVNATAAGVLEELEFIALGFSTFSRNPDPFEIIAVEYIRKNPTEMGGGLVELNRRIIRDGGETGSSYQRWWISALDEFYITLRLGAAVSEAADLVTDSFRSVEARFALVTKQICQSKSSALLAYQINQVLTKPENAQDAAELEVIKQFLIFWRPWYDTTFPSPPPEAPKR